VRFVWGRLIRDSASEALPLSQIGGYLFGARALTLSGVASSFAAASTVVDVTVELVAQLGYVLLGLALLYGFRPGSTPIAPILGCVGLMGALVSLFVAVQARGAGLAEKAWARMAHELLGREIIRSSTIQTEIRAIHSESATLALAATIHLTTWVWGGAETWLTLRLMGVPLPFSAALVIDSLLYGARSIAFMVPNAFGVQEGALVLLGSLFGVGPDTALALSFIKRGRDLIIGIPALLVWQAIEGRRAWREQAIDPGKASAE
jgi:putative membrane protein